MIDDEDYIREIAQDLKENQIPEFCKRISRAHDYYLVYLDKYDHAPAILGFMNTNWVEDFFDYRRVRQIAEAGPGTRIQLIPVAQTMQVIG